LKHKCFYKDLRSAHTPSYSSSFNTCSRKNY